MHLTAEQKQALENLDGAFEYARGYIQDMLSIKTSDNYVIDCRDYLTHDWCNLKLEFRRGYDNLEQNTEIIKYLKIISTIGE